MKKNSMILLHMLVLVVAGLFKSTLTRAQEVSISEIRKISEISEMERQLRNIFSAISRHPQQAQSKFAPLLHWVEELMASLKHVPLPPTKPCPDYNSSSTESFACFDTQDHLSFSLKEGQVWGRQGTDQIMNTQFASDLTISRKHFEVVKKDGKLGIIDHSTNGTSVNGKTVVKGQFVELAFPAMIAFGEQSVHCDKSSVLDGMSPDQIRLKAKELASAISCYNPLTRKAHPLVKGQVWGRTGDSVEVSSEVGQDLTVSRQHFSIQMQNGQLGIVDSSLNGTMINGQNIAKGVFTPMTPPLILEFGQQKFFCDSAQGTLNKSPAEIEARMKEVEKVDFLYQQIGMQYHMTTIGRSIETPGINCESVQETLELRNLLQEVMGVDAYQHGRQDSKNLRVRLNHQQLVDIKRSPRDLIKAPPSPKKSCREGITLLQMKKAGLSGPVLSLRSSSPLAPPVHSLPESPGPLAGPVLQQSPLLTPLSPHSPLPPPPPESPVFSIDDLLARYDEEDSYKCEAKQMNQIVEYWKGYEADPEHTRDWQTTPVSAQDSPDLPLPRPEKPLVVVGDTHGDLNAFMAPLIKNGLAQIDDPPFKFVSTLTGKEVSFSEMAAETSLVGKVLKIPNLKLTPNPKSEVIFLGDTIDRGNHDAESLYLLNDLLRKQKAMGQKAINYVVGNHEVMLLGQPGSPTYEDFPRNRKKADTPLAKNIMKELISDDLAKLSYQKQGMHFSHSYLSVSFLNGIGNFPDVIKNPDLVEALKVLKSDPPNPDASIRERATQAVSDYVNGRFKSMILSDPDFADKPENEWLLGENGPLWCRCSEAIGEGLPAKGLLMGVGHSTADNIGDHFTGGDGRIYNNLLAFDIGQSEGYKFSNPGHGVITGGSPSFMQQQMKVPRPGIDAFNACKSRR